MLKLRFSFCAVMMALWMRHACGQALSIHADKATSYAFHSLQIGGGGFITGVLFHPAVKGLAYVRTDIGGAYRWDEAAGQWTSLNEWVSTQDANLLGIESFAVDASHPDDLFLAAGTYTKPGVPSGAILRSHDRGAHFDVIPLPFQLGGNEPGRFAGERLALDLSSPGTLYLGTRNDGLWRSKDDGSTWQPVSSFAPRGEHGLGILFVLSLPHADDGKHLLYAGVADRTQSLYVSEDSGDSWTPVRGAPEGMFPYRSAATEDGTLYVTYGNGPGPNDVTAGAVYRRDTRGKWVDITPAKPAAGEAGWGYAGLTLDVSHRTVMVSTLDRWNLGDTVFRSKDGGKSWVSLKESAVMDASYSPFLQDEKGATPFGHWIAALGIDPFQPEHAIYGTGATLWETHDLLQADRKRPVHWTVDTRGIEETAVLTLLKLEGDALYAGLGDIGCFRATSTDAGVEATPFAGLALSNCDSIAAARDHPQTMAAVGRTWGKPQHGGYSVDGGLHWTPFSSDAPDGNEGGRVAITPDGAAIFWTTRVGSFVSFNSGKSWQPLMLHPGLELSVEPATATEAFLLDSKAGDLYDVTWTRTLADNSPPKWLLNMVAHVPSGLHLRRDTSTANGLWLFGDQGLFLFDRATNEMRAASRIQAAYALGFGKADGKGSTLFLAGQIAGDKGVYRSTDAGDHWVKITDAQHGFGWITAVSGDPDVFGRVYLGTNGLGVIVGQPEIIEGNR